jgi:hypothetical protein
VSTGVWRKSTRASALSEVRQRPAEPIFAEAARAAMAGAVGPDRGGMNKIRPPSNAVSRLSASASALPREVARGGVHHNILPSCSPRTTIGDTCRHSESLPRRDFASAPLPLALILFDLARGAAFPSGDPRNVAAGVVIEYVAETDDFELADATYSAALKG